MAPKKQKAKSSQKRTTSIWILVLSLFILELLFYTWCRVQCVQTGYAIARQVRKQKELEALQNSLRIELARLKAPERISRIARNQLGLHMPDPRQTVVMP